MKRRAILVWLVLFAVYAGTLGLRAFGRSQYAAGEPLNLLTAKSLVEDGDINVFDDYRDRAYRSFYPYPLASTGSIDRPRAVLYDTTGAGFPLLIAPAHWVGGGHGVELFLAALAALAVALAYLLALRVAPDPWALGATLAVGLSPPFLAYGTAVYPELAAGAVLAGSALLALAAAEAPSRARVFGSFALLALLPWLGVRFVPAGLVIAAFLIRRLRASRHGLLALIGAEVIGFSAALYVGVNEGFYGGLTPYSAAPPGHSPTGASTVGDYVDRVYRLGALFIDRDYGLLRWSPVLALALVGGWLVWRGRRERLAAAVSGYAAMSSAAGLCAAVLLVQYVVAAFLAPTMFGLWFPGRQLMAALPLAIPLAAWGLRHAPRIGSVLAVIGVAASAWLYVDVRLGDGGLAAERPDAPWGPLVHAFPLFDGSAWSNAVAVAIAAGIALFVWWDERQWRRLTTLGFPPAARRI